MVAPRFEQRSRQPQGVGHHHVVVGHAVHEQQRAFECARERYQVGTLVVLRLDPRITEVALGVVRVVQPPLGDRCTGHRRVEHVGAAQHCERGQVATERPAANAHPCEIEREMRSSDALQRGHLVVEHGRREVTAHRTLPLRAARWRTTTVAHDHGVALVGEPLRGRKGVATALHAQRVRTAVRIEQHG